MTGEQLTERATRAINALVRRGWSWSAQRFVNALEQLAERAERPGEKER